LTADMIVTAAVESGIIAAQHDVSF